MGNALIVVIVLLNMFSILLSIKMLNGFDGAKMVGYIVVGEIINLIICNIIYSLTGAGIPTDVHQASKAMILFTMLPINFMLIFCPIAGLINKKSFDEISEDDYKKRMAFCIALAVILVVVEVIYIKNIQLGIAKYSNY